VPVVVFPNTLFLSGQFNPIHESQVVKRYVLENFYCATRRHFSLLIEQDSKPTGDLWNYDTENRRPQPKGILPYWQYGRQMPGLKEVNFWNAHCSLPSFFWNAETDMNCLRIVPCTMATSTILSA